MPKLSGLDRAAEVSANEARRRRDVALAGIREMELEEKRKNLLPAGEVRKVWEDRLGALKDRVLMLPDRLAARLANRSEADIRAALRDELDECLRGIHADAQRGY